MEKLERLKNLIDEQEYPHFEDAYLLQRLAELETEYGASMEKLARELCFVKAGIQEIKIGDVTIPSPKEHFLFLAAGYRKNQTGTVVRIDGI